MVMYGQDDYYPGESDYESDGGKSTDDFHSYGDQRELSDASYALLERRAKARGRNDHFAAGAVTPPPQSRLTGAPSAIALAAHEKWNRDAGNAANLAADQQIHNRAVHEQIHKGMSASVPEPMARSKARLDKKP